MDFRKSTGLRYAKIRRTSGVSPISFPPPPQPPAVGEFHLHGPRACRDARRFPLHKLPLPALGSPLPPIPLLKGPECQSFLGTELPHPQPALPIARDDPLPLCGAPLHMAIRCDLHDSLLYRERDCSPHGGCFLFSPFSSSEGRTPCDDRLRMHDHGVTKERDVHDVAFPVLRNEAPVCLWVKRGPIAH